MVLLERTTSGKCQIKCSFKILSFSISERVCCDYIPFHTDFFHIFGILEINSSLIFAQLC